MSIYDDLKAVASDILESDEFKQGIVYLVKISAGSGPPDDPGPPIETFIELQGVLKGISMKYVKQGFIAISDLELTCSIKENVTPSAGDYIEVNSTRYKILEDVSTPAGSPVVWKFIVRRGA